MDNNGYMFFNLLPYREQIKKEKIKQFSLLMGGFSIIAGILIFIIYSAISFGIESQMSRNKYIADQNSKLDGDIKAISTLKSEIKDTLAKRKVVENLQVNRSDSVNILNTIALQLPEGMTLKSVKEVDDKLTIIGTTVSNNKVSNYMTDLAASNVFINPELIEVKATQITTKKQNAKVRDDQNISEFTIVVYLKPKVTEDEIKGKFKNKKIIASPIIAN